MACRKGQLRVGFETLEGQAGKGKGEGWIKGKDKTLEYPTLAGFKR
jgi:hypothetical protein